MAAAKEKSSSRWAAWLAPILFLLAAVVAAPTASASMTRALETRAWEKTSSPLESCQFESLQLLNLHQPKAIAGYNDALGSPLAAKDAAGDAAGNKVKWVDENAHMGDAAIDYDSGATGSRSNIATKKPQAPEITYKGADGSDAKVRFDGQEGDTLIDRKTSVTTFPKSQNQALRQSEALAQNGLKGKWEVPTAAEKTRAEKMFTKLGIKNITVEVVPQK